MLSDTLGNRLLTGDPMHIHLKSNCEIKPTRIFTTKPTPAHLKEAADRFVEQAISDGIICPVDNNTITSFLSRGFFVPKANKKDVRLVVDLSPLNKFVERPVHGFTPSMELVKSIEPDSKVFCKLDALHGYYQIPLDHESSLLTTFLLPSGRYRFLRAPMGLSSSSDEFCYRTDRIIAGLPGVLKLIDDILVQAPSMDVLMTRVQALLERCRANGLTLSKKKLEIGPEVTFAGFVVSASGIKPDPGKVDAISNFPVPKNVTAVRSFLGLANQLGQFIPDLAILTDPLRHLLKKNTAFTWLPDHSEAFAAVKKALTSELVLRPYNPELPTKLLTDASRLYGIGFALVQPCDSEDDKRFYLIQCGSRSLLPAETRYATIELELLAIAYAVMKCRHYCHGTTVDVLTDHRPLVGIFSKELDSIENSRIMRLREKLLPFHLNVTWVAGKSHLIADALSRSPVDKPEEDDNLCPDETSVANRIRIPDDSDICYHAVQLQSLVNNIDNEYRSIMEALSQGKIPNDLPSSHPARALRSVWDVLSIEDGLILVDGHRIFVPAPARKRILELLHKPHLGLVKSKIAARQLYFWPNMNNDVKQLVEGCSACQELLPSRPKEELVTRDASGPMDQVAVDLFSNAGMDYLVCVDRFSGWLWTCQLKKTLTSNITNALTRWFNDFGWPNSIISDSGPQFRSEFADFCAEKSIQFDTSSAHFHSSNGLVEAGVKSIKYLLKKYNDSMNSQFFTALQELRNSPRADGYSPAQLFLGRRQRGVLPVHHRTTEFDPGIVQAGAHKRQQQRAKTKRKFDETSHLLPEFRSGAHVRVQHPTSKRWDQIGQVIRPRNALKRSYIVKIGSRFYVRNKRFLRPLKSAVPSDNPEGDPDMDRDTDRDYETKAEETDGSLRRSRRVRFRPDRLGQ